MTTRRDEHKRHSAKVTCTKRWQVLRLKIMERDEWRCVKCGDFRRLEVDHIEPVRTHPELSFEASNLQTLCRVCHSEKTRHEVGFRPISQDRQDWRQLLKKEAKTHA